MNGYKYVSPQPFEILDFEFLKFVAVVIPVERVLKGEAVGDLVILPDHHTTRAQFPFLNFEFTARNVKHVILPSEYSRKEPHFCPGVEPTVCCPVAAVDERVLFSRVPMEVAEEQD